MVLGTMLSRPIVIALAAACATAAQAALVLHDPLSGPPLAGSRFQVNGGAFVAAGWKVTAKTDSIIWHVSTIGTGALEFDVAGLNAAECRSGMQDHSELFHMYDWTFGNSDTAYNGGYRDNPYKHFIRKTGAGYWAGNPAVFVDCRGNSKTDSMEILWKLCPGNASGCQANYLESDTALLAWSPNTGYHFRLEWTSGSSSCRLKTYRNGTLIMDQSLPGTYAPAGQSIRIGASPRGDTYAGAPVDAVFSNLKVYDTLSTEPPVAPAISTPADGATVTERTAFIRWTGETHSGFQVRINTQNSAQAGILWDSGEMTSPKDFCLTGPLPDNATCYAFVRLANAAGYGGWSQGRRFLIKTSEAPPGPSLVQLEGDTFKDHTGHFNGLGVTYMQAMRRCKYDRTRFHSDLTFLAARGFMSPRILTMVGWYPYWDGYEIAPISFASQAGKSVAAWPDYWQQFRDCIDIIYDHGMRAEITIFADAQLIPNKADRINHMNLLLQNLAGREHKVMFLEVANEAWQNGFPGTQGIADLREFARYLADRTEILVAITSNDDPSNSALTNLHCNSGADLCTVHFDRDIGTIEGGWLPVRDCWRVAYAACVPPTISNEPIGPGSSVASENDPVKLVSAAIFAWIANLPGYVFHSSAGVKGIEAFENVPGINNFGHLRTLLPKDLVGWVRNDGLEAAAPFTVYANGQENRYWPDVANPSSGVVRNCGSIRGNEFICLPMGIQTGGVDLRARRLVSFTVYNPLNGSVVDTAVRNVGDPVYHLPPGPGAYLIKGTFGVPIEVSIDLGQPDLPMGLAHPANDDGDTIPTTVGGRSCRVNADPGTDHYFYFDVSDSFAYQGSKPDQYILIDYYDAGTATLTLHYDSAAGTDEPAIYKNGGSITLTNSQTWKQHVFHVTDAWFGNRQNAGADFRIGSVGNTFYLDVVRVTTKLPEPPVIGEVAPDPEVIHVGMPYRKTLTLLQGHPAPAWSVVQGPAGISIGDDGVVSGWTPQPGGFGTFAFAVQAMNGLGSHEEAWSVRVVSWSDFDLDGDVDQEDFGFLQRCINEHGLLRPVSCASQDLDIDGDVDQADLYAFAACLAGSQRPPACMY